VNTFIKTGVREFDELLPRVKEFLAHDVLEMNIDGERVRGYRSPDSKAVWIRDHSDMIRAARYFDGDLKSTVDHFAATQGANGRIFDYVTTYPEKLPCEKENWTKYVRVPVEADVEYRFIKAAWLTWQATGDDEWILGLIPHMEKALEYIFTHPQRFDPATGLVKRAYTIDTWDFAYTAGKHPWLQFQIDDDTYWGISHGDNSGYYEAVGILERLYGYFKEEGGRRKEKVKDQGSRIKDKVNEVCWNGRFYTHFVKLTPVEIEGVDESQQLSLSNPMAINRGITDHEQAVSIINEYRMREERTHAFAAWFSIDPPFPDGIFGDEKLVAGAYINGGIFPLVGGELAMAALNHGFEEYGVEILRKYDQLISKKNETYLWYFPDGTPSSVEASTSPDAMPTDGWGSSAMAWALTEGLAGIEDRLKLFQKIRISPRWQAAGVTEATVRVEYPEGTWACGHEGVRGYVGYHYTCKSGGVELMVEAGAEAEFHVLVGKDSEVQEVIMDGVPVAFEIERVEQSRYVNFTGTIRDRAHIRINFKE
jgi:hypothetical protein